MERKTLILLGLGLIVIAAAIVLAVQLDILAPGGNAGPATTALQTQGTLRTPATLAPADALKAVASSVQAALDRLDGDTATAAIALGPTDMTGNETRRILRELALASPAAIDATAVSKDGVMLTVEPAEYASAEGADISAQEQVRRLRATQKPAMSGVFATVEGVNATDLEHPVFAPSGQFNGSASLLFQPTFLLTIAVQEALAGRSAEVFVMDTDGLVLYDRDATEVGTIRVHGRPVLGQPRVPGGREADGGPSRRAPGPTPLRPRARPRRSGRRSRGPRSGSTGPNGAWSR